MSTQGYIYILTNPSFKQYVKIGYADDVENRLKQLNNSECIPFSFRIYATYAVDERLTDKKLHSMIDQLNPNLRSKEIVGGKMRVREFYAMTPEQAYSILETIAILGGCKERLKLRDPSPQEKKEENIAQEIEEEHIERLSPFAFSKCHIPVGSVITYFNRGKANSGVECRVVDDKTVKYQEKNYSLSALATELSGSKHGVAGPRYFKYKGEWLNTIRARVEGWKNPTRIDDVWVIPCNPKFYDIVGAFQKLNTIEWSQSTNICVGDTIYIYVGGEYKSIMFKCEAVETELYGNRSAEDLEFYKDITEKPDTRYMRIRLIEKYEKDVFPLDELRDHGLANVQGRSKVTPLLLGYLESNR